MEKIIKGLMVSALTCKDFGSHHYYPRNKKIAEKIENQLFSLVYWEEFTRKTTASKSGEIGKYREL